MVTHNWNAGGKCNLDPSQAATHRLFGHHMHRPDICCYKGRRGFEYGCIPAKLEIYAGFVGQQLRAEVGGGCLFLDFVFSCLYFFLFFWLLSDSWFLLAFWLLSASGFCWLFGIYWLFFFYCFSWHFGFF